MAPHPRIVCISRVFLVLIQSTSLLQGLLVHRIAEMAVHFLGSIPSMRQQSALLHFHLHLEQDHLKQIPSILSSFVGLLLPRVNRCLLQS